MAWINQWCHARVPLSALSLAAYLRWYFPDDTSSLIPAANAVTQRSYLLNAIIMTHSFALLDVEKSSSSGDYRQRPLSHKRIIDAKNFKATIFHKNSSSTIFVQFVPPNASASLALSHALRFFGVKLYGLSVQQKVPLIILAEGLQYMTKNYRLGSKLCQNRCRLRNQQCPRTLLLHSLDWEKFVALQQKICFVKILHGEASLETLDQHVPVQTTTSARMSFPYCLCTSCTWCSE